MNAHPRNSVSAMLRNTKTHKNVPGRHSKQTSESVEQGPALSGGVPTRSDSLRGPASAQSSQEQAAAALRSRLLKMIVASEQSRANEKSNRS